MIDIHNIEAITEYLFDCNFLDEDFDSEGKEEHQKVAEALLNENPWSDVFTVWNKYLRGNCSTPESVINFCNLFSYYGGTERPIHYPYDFLGYIFAKANFEKNWDGAGDFLDGLAVSILQKSGDISLRKDPYYQSWRDSKLQCFINKYKG